MAIPFVMPSGVTVKVADSGAGTPHTVTMPTGVYRTLMAYTGGATTGLNSGTEADPNELLGLAAWKINNAYASGVLWQVFLQADARCAVKYLGTGTGTITWDGSGGTTSHLRALLGFNSNISLASGATVTAPYQPMCFGACITRAGDTGWTDSPQSFAGSELPDGSVIGWGDNTHRAMRKWDARFLPYTQADKTTLGAAGTVLWPTSLAKVQRPSRTVDPNYILPWSWYETIRTAAGVQVAVAHGNLQQLIAGSQLTFDVCYLALDTITKPAVALSTANWNARRDWKGMSMFLYAAGTR